MDELQRLAEGLATRIERAVAIDDPQNNLLCHTAHDDGVDTHRVASVMRLRAPDEVIAHILRHGIATADQPVHVPGRTDIDLLPRWCVPLRCQGLLFGYLWIIEPAEGLPEEHVQAAVEVAAEAGQLLYRQQLMDDLRDSRERELLRDLLSADREVASAAARILVDDEMLPPECFVAVLVVQVRAEQPPDLRTTLHTVLRRVGRRAQPLVSLSLARPGGSGVLLLAGPSTPHAAQLRRVAEQARDEVCKVLGGAADVRVGIGPVVAGSQDAATSAERAGEALDVAARIPGFDQVTAWDDLGVYSLLVRLSTDDLTDSALPQGLRTLLAQDGDGVLVETLETWLDEGSDVRRSVAHLRVHRTSLYYRLGRIEEITGLSLDDGRTRLHLHLGLKLARLKGLLGS
jgi:sugar diacid utilization regulator